MKMNDVVLMLALKIMLEIGTSVKNGIRVKAEKIVARIGTAM
jgi:hypothetical protein